MKITNNNMTVTFDSKEEFNKYFDIFNLTLMGKPAVFDFKENDSLTFTIKQGVAVQE